MLYMRPYHFKGIQRLECALLPFQPLRSLARLVFVVNRLGVSVNLQRASHAIIMEPQLQNTTTTQAIKRVHRIGQQFPTTVEILTSKQVEAERVVQDKHALNALFAKMVDEAKKNIDMDDDEDEESDEGVV
jgi:SNF2 family DNA or RNA helicase